MSRGPDKIRENIDAFRRRYYLNLFLRGLLLTLTILFGYFLLAALLEYALWLAPWGRFIIVLSFLVIAVYCVYRFLKEPLRFWISQKGMGDEQSARLIGNFFPDIKDRLVNLIQLIGIKENSVLAYASVEQKTRAFEPIRFDSVIDLGQNKKYLKYLAVPIGLILFLIALNSSILTQSAYRIVNFNQQFAPIAPFAFTVQNKSLVGFFNEDFTLALTLEGAAIPDASYILLGTQRVKMETTGAGSFQYTFEKLQESKTIRFEAAGFYSSTFELSLANRPELTQLKLNLEYPKYLQRRDEQLVNAGSLEVPEGTVATWEIRTANTLQAALLFASDNQPVNIQSSDNQLFTYKKGFNNPDQYEVILENEHSRNKERIAYRIDVIKDQHPQIAVNNFRDSVLYQRIVLGGVVSDDYGLSKLMLQFHVKTSDQTNILSKSVNIPIGANQPQQSFFYNWSIDSLRLKPGEYLEYYLQVWDNDGVNGHKSTRSSVYTFFVPDKDELVTEISKSQSQAEQKLEETVSKATELKKQIDDAQQKMKGKSSLDWQDKKKLEEILEQKKSLEELIKELRDQNRLLDQKKDAFTEQDERIREKAEQIQKLMDELLDEETKRLMEELERLLKENTDVSHLKQLMDKLNKNSKNLEKELERTLELFKQLKFEFKVDQAIKDLEKNLEDQESLHEKTESLEKEMNKDQKGKNQDKAGDSETSKKAEDLANEQEKVAEEFRKTEEKLDELRELGEELNQGDELPDEELGKEVEESQQNSKENLENNSPSQSKQSQQKAIQKMQEMQQQMQEMQGSMSMEIDAQNLETLRQIIHGLIKLSHDQEGLMKQFAQLEQSDPRFNALAQHQLKLKDDLKVLEDSLLALGKRDPMMGSFITREVTELNDHLDKTIEAYRERRRPQISTEMQFSMTSINNLALMLDSHFDMMMNMMANAKASGKKGKQKGKQNSPSLGQMQQQLNNKIEELKNSGKSGRQLSEELAEMAAEQERIRRALQEMQEKMKEGGEQLPGGNLPDQMEDTEIDLVNKRLTDQLIQRQREILTRLLETEKSLREQDMDEERKGETAKDYAKEMPLAIEEYLKLKEKEVELLKTVPPKLFPFYRKEVNEYFKRLREN
jgi:hypothetical protein